MEEVKGKVTTVSPSRSGRGHEILAAARIRDAEDAVRADAVGEIRAFDERGEHVVGLRLDRDFQDDGIINVAGFEVDNAVSRFHQILGVRRGVELLRDPLGDFGGGAFVIGELGLALLGEIDVVDIGGMLSPTRRSSDNEKLSLRAPV